MGRLRTKFFGLTALAVIAGLTLTVSLFASSAAAQRDAGTTIQWTGQGTNADGSCQQIGPSDDLHPAPGQEGWIFILNGANPATGWTLSASFSGGQSFSGVAPLSIQNQNVHFAVYTNVGSKLLNASAFNPSSSATANNLVVSHCSNGTGTSSMSTTILNNATNQPFSNLTQVPPDSFVRDTANVNSTAGIPQGTVTFTFWTGGSCGTGKSNAAGSASVNAGGLADGSTVEGPLAPGDYAFSAHFASSDTSKWTNADSGCEPFHVPTPPSANLTATKNANPSFNRLFNWTIQKNVDKTEIDVAGDGTATFNYTVSVTKSDPIDSGWQVTGKITVNNPNSMAVSGVNITDAINDANATCSVSGGSNVTLGATSVTSFNYTCTYSAAPSSSNETNTATISWPDQKLQSGFVWLAAGSAPATAAVNWGAPTNVTNDSITVNDTNGQSWTFNASGSQTYSVSHQGVPGTCQKYDNTATIKQTGQSASQEVKVCSGVDLKVSKTAAPSYTRTYTWGIKKSVDQNRQNIPQGSKATFNYTVEVSHDNGTDSGWQVKGQITVSNPNNWESITFDLADVIDNGGNCSISGGGSGLTLAPSASGTFDYVCDYSSAPSPAAFNNTATATWDKAVYSTPDGSASGSASGAFGDPTTIVDGSVNVKDSLGGDLGTVSYTDPSPKTLTYPITFDDPAGTCTAHDNTASFVTNTTGTTGSDSQRVMVCVGVDLTVAKDANPSYTRTFKWDIQKSVDQTEQHIAEGSKATFNYTVSVTHDAGTDSGWQVAGTIKVSNPNDWESIDASVSDAVDNGGSCLVEGDAVHAVTIAASDSINLHYVCSYSSAPSPSAGANTVTVNWDKDKAATPDNSAADTVKFAFGDPTTIVDGSADVTDSLGGHLGTVSYTDPSPTTFTYPITFDDPAGTCTTHDNTAIFTTNTSGTTGSASQEVKVCVGSDLQVTKNATPFFTRTFKWDISKSVDNPRLNIPAGGTATSNYTVVVTHDGGTDSGWQVQGEIKVTNPNDWESITFDLSDAIDNGGDCSITGGGSGLSLAPGASGVFDYVCNYSSPPSAADFTNKATASWDAAKYSTPDGSMDGTASGKFGDPTTILGGSDHVTDTNGKSWDVSYTDPSPQTFTYSIDRQGNPGTCTDYPNTASFVVSETGQTGSASADVNVCVGVDLQVSKTANPTFTRQYTWRIEKSVDQSSQNIPQGGKATFNYKVAVSHDNGTDSGWKVTGEINVTNPNNWEPITFNLSDVIDNGGDCSISGGGSNLTLGPGASGTFDYVCSYSSAPTKSDFTNTATATWDPAQFSTPDGTNSGSAVGNFNTPSSIVDGSVNVTDSLGGSLGTVSYTDPSPTILTYSHDFAGVPGTCTTYPNTATFTTSDTGTTGSASQNVKVCVGEDLSVSKTAKSSFIRTYKWNISKSVDKTKVTLTGGGSATFNYTVSVTHDNGTDSAWIVTGSITVSNPNDWEAITMSNLADAIDNGGTCSITSGDPTQPVPANGSATFGYSCSYSSPPSKSDFTNTATAKWNASQYATPDGSSSGSASGSFSTPSSIVDGSVNVSDTLKGALGTVSYTDPSPKTFTYSLTFPAPPAGSCVDHPNTASFTAKDSGATGSASQKVTVCNYNAPLTPGYWKNHLTAASGSPYTAQYLPQLLGNYSVTTTAIATSIWNLMNCGNASTSSQNAIGCLTGHLLATELNLANHSDPCILPAVQKASAWLKGVAQDGVPGVVYTGPSSTYTLTQAQRNEAILLKNPLDNYNNGLGC